MNWLYLYTAIAFEIFGTTALKLSNGMQKPWVFVTALVLYAISFVLLSQSLKTMSIGITYAIWSGAGTLLVILIGIFWFKEVFTAWHGLFMAMIIIGAVGLNLTSSSH